MVLNNNSTTVQNNFDNESNDNYPLRIDWKIYKLVDNISELKDFRLINMIQWYSQQ